MRTHQFVPVTTAYTPVLNYIDSYRFNLIHGERLLQASRTIHIFGKT